MKSYNNSLVAALLAVSACQSTPTNRGELPPPQDAGTAAPNTDGTAPMGSGCVGGCPGDQFCNTTLGVCQPRQTDDPLCNDSCPTAGDGECDDGGPMCEYALDSCPFGTDCTDCGPRTEDQRPTDPPGSIDCPCNMDCPEGSMCNPMTLTCDSCASCGARQCGRPVLNGQILIQCPECGQCAGGQQCGSDGMCQDCGCGGRACGVGTNGCSCGSCQDDEVCSAAGQCQRCDCGARQCGDLPGNPGCFCGSCDQGQFCTTEGTCMANEGTPLCNNTCSRAGDGDCDDGGPMCSSVSCNFGTDCADCGPRTEDQRPDPNETRICR